MIETPPYLRNARSGLWREDFERFTDEQIGGWASYERPTSYRESILGLILAALLLFLAAQHLGCGGVSCHHLEQAVEIACTADPGGDACRIARSEFEHRFPNGCGSPSPTPEPSPTVEPSPSPTATPTVPPPTPPPAVCPWEFPANCRRDFGAKVAGHGVDSTPWIQCSNGDYCRARGWTDGRSTCAVAPEGNPHRLTCELQFFGGCPTWEFKTPGDATVRRLVDDHGAEMSGDHFGVQSAQDDPQTPTTGDTLETLRGFEGLPKVCGLQRDSHGPLAGFFVVAHGLGHVRPCPADEHSDAECGPWIGVDH